VAWIDERDAKLFAFDRKNADQEAVHHMHGDRQIRHTGDGAHLREITDALAGFSEILIVGPGHAKWQLRAYLNQHAPRISQRVMAVLQAERQSDRQIVAQARKYFSRIDRLTPLKVARIA
jgi:stalled ribosome rescue protein Dom34